MAQHARKKIIVRPKRNGTNARRSIRETVRRVEGLALERGGKGALSISAYQTLCFRFLGDNSSRSSSEISPVCLGCLCVYVYFYAKLITPTTYIFIACYLALSLSLSVSQIFFALRATATFSLEDIIDACAGASLFLSRSLARNINCFGSAVLIYE